MRFLKRYRFPALSLLLMASSLLGCSKQKPEQHQTSVDTVRESFFLVHTSNAKIDEDLRLITETFPKVKTGPIDPLPSHHELLVVPWAEQLDENEWQSLVEAFNTGQDILLFGKNPLGHAVRVQPGVRAEQASPETADIQQMLQGMSDIPFWNPATLEKRIYSEVKAIQLPSSTVPVFSLQLSPSPSPLYISSPLSATKALESISFFARSQTQIPWTVSVEQYEGGLFSAQLHPQDHWQRFTFSPEAFRSIEDDAPLSSFDEARILMIGQDPRVVPAPYRDAALEFTPPLEGKSVSGRTAAFPFLDPRATRVSQIMTRDWIPMGAAQQEPVTTYIPLSRIHFPDWSNRALATGVNAQGRTVPLLSQFFNKSGLGGSLLWCGTGIMDLNQNDRMFILKRAVNHANGQSRLLDVYLSQAAIPDQTAVTLNYSIRVDTNSPAPIIIQSTMVHPEGRVMGHSIQSVYTPPHHDSVITDRMMIPGFTQNDRRLMDYDIEVRLLEGRGSVLERETLRLPLKVFASPPEIDNRFFLKANGTLFRLGRNGLFLNAIDYTPLVSADTSAVDWLAPPDYPEEVIRFDLHKIREAGFNCIRIELPSLSSPYSLRSLSEELIRHGLLGVIRLPDIPVSQLASELPEFIRISSLRNMPHWVGIELNARQIHRDIVENIDRDWADWWASRKQTDAPSPPPPTTNDLLYNQGEGLFTAFANDQAAIRLARAGSILRANGLFHMISLETSPNHTAKAGDNPRSCFDFRAGLGLVDYSTVSSFHAGRYEAHTRSHSDHLAKLVRGLTGGTPLVWSGISAKLGARETRTMLDYQKEQHARHTETAGKTWAAGSIVERYKDVDHTLRKGLWSTGVGPRPAVDVYTAKINRSRDQRQTPIPWRGARIAGNPKADALTALMAAIEALNIDGKEEVRHIFFNRPTTQLDLRRMGTHPHAPFESINALWTSIQTEETTVLPMPSEPITLTGRKPVELTVLNNGQASWSASRKGLMNSVWVEVLNETQAPRYLPVKALHMAKTQVIPWFPNTYGRFQLRPYLWGKGPFGQRIVVDIRSPDAETDSP